MLHLTPTKLGFPYLHLPTTSHLSFHHISLAWRLMRGSMGGGNNVGTITLLHHHHTIAAAACGHIPVQCESFQQQLRISNIHLVLSASRHASQDPDKRNQDFGAPALNECIVRPCVLLSPPLSPSHVPLCTKHAEQNNTEQLPFFPQKTSDVCNDVCTMHDYKLQASRGPVASHTQPFNRFRDHALGEPQAKSFPCRSGKSGAG